MPPADYNPKEDKQNADDQASQEHKALVSKKQSHESINEVNDDPVSRKVEKDDGDDEPVPKKESQVEDPVPQKEVKEEEEPAPKEEINDSPVPQKDDKLDDPVPQQDNWDLHVQPNTTNDANNNIASNILNNLAFISHK